MNDTEDVKIQLKELLKIGEDWEDMETPIPGVFVARAPGTKKKPPLLYLKINPLGEHGKPVKRKGVYLGSVGEFEQFKALFQNEWAGKLMRTIEEVNPVLKKPKKLKF